jgi:SAM-dependent methyltransferase
MSSARANDATQLDNPAFYDRHWEHADTSRDPHVVAKGDLLMGMIPSEVRTIADVGCGDGYLTQRLAERWDVIGVDRSPVALAKLSCRTIQASADALPLPDRSVDLLLSSQVLEHLPDGVLERALREMDRVASRWLVVSVPYREQIGRRVVRCPSCRLEFHIDGHLRSFDERAIDRALPTFERVRTELCGPPELPTYPSLERARQRLAKRWYIFQGANIVCPRCGETRFEQPPRNLAHRLLDQAINRATTLANRWSGRKSAPYWIVTLMRRRGT